MLLGRRYMFVRVPEIPCPKPEPSQALEYFPQFVDPAFFLQAPAAPRLAAQKQEQLFIFSILELNDIRGLPLL